jgi:hypothetical protein
MNKSKLLELKISDYSLLSNGTDGGHHYISTEIEYKTQLRKIAILFSDKSDEKKILDKIQIIVKGELIDDGIGNPLLLMNSTIKDSQTIRILNRLENKLNEFLNHQVSVYEFNDFMKNSIEAIEGLSYEDIQIANDFEYKFDRASFCHELDDEAESLDKVKSEFKKWILSLMN